MMYAVNKCFIVILLVFVYSIDYGSLKSTTDERGIINGRPQLPVKRNATVSPVTSSHTSKHVANITATVQSSINITSGNSTLNNTSDISNTNNTDSTPSFRVKTWNFLNNNRGALQRTFYVLIGVSLIILIYFVVRAVRMKRKRNKSRKYGLIASNEAALEMEPLDQNDDDEDEVTTLFEAKSHRRHR